MEKQTPPRRRSRTKKWKRRRRRIRQCILGILLIAVLCLTSFFLISHFLHRNTSTPQSAAERISPDEFDPEDPLETPEDDQEDDLVDDDAYTPEVEDDADPEDEPEDEPAVQAAVPVNAPIPALPVMTEGLHDYSTVPYPYAEEAPKIPAPKYEKLLRNSKKKLDLKKKFGDHFIISHAMGGIDGRKYSNCLEAFEENYKEGHRIFEADFCYTSDHRIVLWHSWNHVFSSNYPAYYIPTYDEFMSSRIYDQYTPMSLESLLELLDKYPKAYLVTDTKYYGTRSAANEFTTIIQTAIDMNLTHVLDQIIPQVYNEAMYKAITQLHKFPAYIFTLYHRFDEAPTEKQFKSIVKFCSKNKIGMITMWGSWYDKKYIPLAHKKDILLALHTYNTEKTVTKRFRKGIDAVYSDFLTPKGKEVPQPEKEEKDSE